MPQAKGSRRTVEDWRRLIYRTSRVHPSTRILLLWLSDHMSADRKVSVPRDRIAQALGLSERRLAERFRDAVESGFLSKLGGGYRGRTAEYQGLFGDERRESMSPTSTQSSRDSSTQSTPERVHPGCPASSTQDNPEFGQLIALDAIRDLLTLERERVAA